MSELILLDSCVLLRKKGIDVSSLLPEEQITMIYELAKQALAEKGLSMNQVILTSNEVEDMSVRPALDAVQKRTWTEPAYYPCRITVSRGGDKAGAAIRCVFTAVWGEHQQVNADDKLKPNSPFSCAAVVGKRVYCSGARPMNPATASRISDDVGQCVVQCLSILDVNLKACGTSLKGVYRFLVFLPNLSDAPRVMEVLKEQGICEKTVQIQFELVDAINGGDPVEIACDANIE